MIVHTMSISEIQTRISDLFPIIHTKANTLAAKYYKAFLKKPKTNKPVIFSTVEKIKVKNNVVYLLFGSNTGSYKDFGSYKFLVLDTDHGKEYIQIMAGGLIRRITKHFIDRFIERSSYNCDKNNFLPYLVKELTPRNAVVLNNEIQYLHTLNGLVVYQNQTMITYLNDLSQYKESMRELSKSNYEKMGYTRKYADDLVSNEVVLLIKETK